MSHPIYTGFGQDDHISKAKGTQSASLAIRPDATATEGPLTRDMKKKVSDSDKHYGVAAKAYRGNVGYGPNLGTEDEDGPMAHVIKKNRQMHDSLDKVRNK